jgi:hypothetical protein
MAGFANYSGYLEFRVNPDHVPVAHAMREERQAGNLAGVVRELDRPQLLPGCAGCGDERRQHDLTGRFPMRSHVGVRFLTMTTFLNAFLSQPKLRPTRVEELDTRMQPWQPASADGRIIPWNIAITARAIAESGG